MLTVIATASLDRSDVGAIVPAMKLRRVLDADDVRARGSDRVARARVASNQRPSRPGAAVALIESRLVLPDLEQGGCVVLGLA